MQDRFVITIGRQLGSGGRAIGKRIAERLGIRMYDRQLLDMAAEQSGLCPQCFEEADEKQSRRVLSTLIGYLRSPFAGDTGTDNNVLSNDALFKIQSDVIRNVAARESALFVGRCADYILRDDPHCISVFITADCADRTVGDEPGQSVGGGQLHLLVDIAGPDIQRPPEQPREGQHIVNLVGIIRTSSADHSRAAYYNYYSSRTWGEAATYQLCINSSLLGIDGTAECIIDFAERRLQTKF